MKRSNNKPIYNKGNTCPALLTSYQKNLFFFILSHRKACMTTISVSYQNESILHLCKKKKKKKNAIAQEQPG